MPLLEVSNLKTWFPVHGGLFRRLTGHIKAVDGVSFTVEPGQTVGLVGESGSGKTTVGRTILKLIPATSGRVVFDGREILPLSEKDFRPFRREMQMIFQDPFSSINPKLSIGTAISEAAGVRGVKRDLQGRAKELLGMVGLPESILKQYPHQLSGGQRQRVAIARSLAAEPEILVADEPVSSLDMSVQAQIMNLFFDLKKKLGLSYIIISHDLNLLAVACDNIMVMKSGKAVEYGPARAIIKNPQNEYTKKLIDAIPRINEKN